MSLLSNIFGLIVVIVFGITLFNVFATFFGSLLGMAAGILQLLLLLPWLLLEKVAGIKTPSWVMKLIDAIGWINPAKWIK